MDGTEWPRQRKLYMAAVALAVLGHFLMQADPSGDSLSPSPSPALPTPSVNTTRPPPAPPPAAIDAASMQRLRDESLAMFNFSFNGYMAHAFPRDDLRPLSCRGHNSQGGIALTLLDALDMLVLAGNPPALQKAVHWVEHEASFDVDARVHVFEVTIRALGGLLSTHALILKDPSLVPGYSGALLRAATDLGDRLLPAFDTPTGIPLSWINLRSGQVRGDTRITCTACAGTLLLEFGVLSRLSGNGVYEAKAKHAITTLWEKRSARNLVGNTINVDTGVWSRRDSGVGAGVDSFYEYLLKAYLAFGDEAYLTMFSEAYAAAQAQMALSPEVNGVSWPVDVHMTSGRVLHTYVSALSAFWPGLQALVGQTQEAATLHANWMAAWERFKWTPDMFHLYLQQQHPTMVGYPLRPEIIESAFLLYATTGDGAFVGAGQAIQERLQQTAKGKCGYASVGDVATGRLEDTMESFFLSETVKYLYLLFANATAVVDHFVLSTEGHLLPVFPGGKREYAAETAATEAWKLGSVGVNATAVEAKLRDNCSALCDSDTRSGRKAATASLRSALPWLPLDPGAVRLLRQRRCKACRTVTRAVAAATVRADLMWRSAADSPMVADKPQAAPAHWALSRQPAGVRPRQFLCMLTPSGRRKLGCSVFSEVPYESLTSQAVQALPHNALFLQVTDSSALPPPSAETWAQALVEVELESWNAAGRAGLPAMLAEFGPDLLPGCNASDPAAVAAARAAWDEELERRKKFEFEHEEEDDDDREESEEEVRRRIAALARAGEQCGTGAGASASTGSGNECHSGNNNGGDRGTHGSSCSCSADSGASSGCGCGDKKDPSLGPEGSAGSQNPDDDDEYLDPDEDSGDSQQQQGSHQGGEGVADGELLDAAAVCDAQGVVVMVQPRDACTQLKNPERLHGAVAVIHRGNCTFQSKVLAAQNAGAVGVVIVDSMPKGGLSSMGGDANAAVPVIPAVLVRAREQAVLEATAEAGGKVRVWRPPLARRVQLGEVLMKESVNVTSGRDGQGATCSAVDASMPGSNGTCPVTGPREEPQGQLTVEMVLPPNSNSWVMHQIYQRDMDLTPAFNQLADYLGATTGD